MAGDDRSRVIRRASVDDADAVAEVHVASWRAAYRGIVAQEVLDGLSVAERANAYRGHLADPSAELGLFVCEDEGRVVAFATCGPAGDDEPAHVAALYALYADPAAWDTGAGRALMSAVLSELRGRGYRELVVIVLDDNGRARRFYERAGFALEATGEPLQGFDFDLTQARYRLPL